MVSLSVDGLVSGLDTTSLISQLISAESASQTRLKVQLSTTKAAADAYREVNTKVDAVRTAAAALTSEGLAAARTASSSSESVSASATSTAVAGSRISFTVLTLASTASFMSGATWKAGNTDVRTPGPDPTAPAESPWPLTISRPDGSSVTIEPPEGATLAQTVAYINGREDLGLRATTVNVGSDGLRLQLTSTTPGEAGDFVVETTAGVDFELTSPATDAVLDLGGTLRARSATNTFADLIAGVSVTVTERNASAVVEVAEDPATVAAKVKTLVDAVNSALSSIKKHSSTATGSTAVLKGDSELRTLALQLRDAVSDTVAGAGSPATVGIELNRDGTVKFTEKTFLAALQSDPEVAGRLLSGAPQEGATPAVEGISQRLQALAKRATDSTTGSLTLLAEGRDELADDFQDRIDSWDLRLELRRETLTRQFTAMETALSSLKSQSSWLAGQLGSLSG